MATRKVTVTATRTYIKTTTIEVEVDENITGEALQNHLAHDKDVDAKIEEGIGQASLNGGDTEYQYSDPENNDGGHL
jgi:hypothetical protein